MCSAMLLYGIEAYISIAVAILPSLMLNFPQMGPLASRPSCLTADTSFIKTAQGEEVSSLSPAGFPRHPTPTSAGLFLPATPTLKATTKPSKGSSAPRARKPFPQSSALRLCRPPLRFALSTPLCSVTRVGIPLSLRLLPPAFARWRSACMSHATATTTATAKEQRL